jgi:hypothetical protein
MYLASLKIIFEKGDFYRNLKPLEVENGNNVIINSANKESQEKTMNCDQLKIRLDNCENVNIFF